MRFLIHLFAEWVARRLEAGNARAGIIGAALGVVAGIAAAYFLGRAEVFGYLKTASYIFLPVLGAFVGGALGAALPGGERIEPNQRVRLNNLNRGLLPLFLFCVFAAGVPLVFLAPHNPKAKEPEPRWPFATGCGIAALVAGVFALRAVLWVDVTEREIIVFRLMGSRSFPLDQVQRWGFEAARGRWSQQAPPAAGFPFVLVLANGFSFHLPSLSPTKAANVVALLSGAGAASAQSS